MKNIFAKKGIILLIILVVSTMVFLSILSKFFTTNNKNTLLQIPEGSSNNGNAASLTPFVIPEPDTSNWQVYTNTSGEYMFKYPTGTKIYDNKALSIDGIMPDAPGKTSITPHGITIEYMNKDKSIEQTIQDNLCLTSSSINKVSWNFNGFEGHLYENTPCGPLGTTYLYLSDIKHIYIITIQGENKTAYELLSTFRPL